MTKETRMSADDNIEYMVLKTPGEVSFHGVKLHQSESFNDGYKFYHLYIKCNELKKTCLPMDANPREPKAGDVVGKMQHTIQLCPDEFHHLNNGISVICAEVKYDSHNETVTISFNEGEGICNGGHTYFSIVTLPIDIDEDCYVHLELIEIPAEIADKAKRKKAINDIASARNRNRMLHVTTEADYLGYYIPFQKCLGENTKYVMWHEGDSQADPDAIKSDHFIRLVASLDPFWFDHPQIKIKAQKPTHKFAASGILAVHNNWVASLGDPGTEDKGDFQRSLYHLAPLSNHILELRDLISYSLKHDDLTAIPGNIRKTSFFDWFKNQERELKYGRFAGEIGYKLPPTLEVLIIGSFRHNIWIGLNEEGYPQLIGVLEDFDVLWDNTKMVLIDKLKQLFQGYDNDPAPFCRSEAPFSEQLIKLAYGMRPPTYPENFYELSTLLQYRHTKNQTRATHCLDISESRYVIFSGKKMCSQMPNAEYYTKKV